MMQRVSKSSYHGETGDICHRFCASFALIVIGSTLHLHCTALHLQITPHLFCIRFATKCDAKCGLMKYNAIRDMQRVNL